MKRGSFISKVFVNRTMLIMLLPALIYVIVFNYIPMGGIMLAFKNYNYQDGIFGSPWVGFENFRFLMVSNKLWELTRNTLLYNAAFIGFGMLFEVGFAIMLSEIVKSTFKKVSQGIMFLPYFISWVVVSSLLLTVFGFEFGVLNRILVSFGADPVNIYGNTSTWPIVMVLLRVWKHTGYGTVIYLAAITSIDQQIYEAADVDGAGVWRKIWSITLPSLKPTMTIMFLLAVGNIFRGDFGMFYQIVGNNQLLLQSSDIIDTFVYRSLMDSPNLGMSAAAGFYQSVLCFVTILAANWMVRKIQPDYALF